MDTLDGMLNALLISAGYAPVTGCRTDLIFTELSAPERDRPRQLRYGWVEYPPFSYSSRGGVKGFAIDIMADIAKLIGVEPFPVKLDWPSLIPTLRAREIDIICPILLELPSRMFQVSFSRVVPKLSIYPTRRSTGAPARNGISTDFLSTPFAVKLARHYARCSHQMRRSLSNMMDSRKHAVRSRPGRSMRRTVFAVS